MIKSGLYQKIGCFFKVSGYIGGLWESEPTVTISPPSSLYRFNVRSPGIGSPAPWRMPEVLTSMPFPREITFFKDLINIAFIFFIFYREAAAHQMAFDQIDMSQAVVFAVGRQFYEMTVIAFCDLWNGDIGIFHFAHIYIFNLVDRTDEIVKRVVSYNIKSLFTG